MTTTPCLRVTRARNSKNGINGHIDIYIPRRTMTPEKNKELQGKIMLFCAWMEENFEAVVRPYID